MQLPNGVVGLLALVGLCTAVPTTKPPSCPICDKNYDANFEDLAATPAGVGVVPNSPTLPYKGLEYVNFAVGSTAVVPAILPHSPPNQGILSTTNSILGQSQALRATYANSKVKSFDLHSFWFGCKVTTGQQANGGPAQACTVQVTGYKQDPQNPAVCDIAGPLIFNFMPGALGLFRINMVQAVLDSTFRGLTNVTLTVTNSEIANQVTSLYTDNFSYTTHEICCS